MNTKNHPPLTKQQKTTCFSHQNCVFLHPTSLKRTLNYLAGVSQMGALLVCQCVPPVPLSVLPVP